MVFLDLHFLQVKNPLPLAFFYYYSINQSVLLSFKLFYRLSSLSFFIDSLANYLGSLVIKSQGVISSSMILILSLGFFASFILKIKDLALSAYAFFSGNLLFRASSISWL